MSITEESTLSWTREEKCRFCGHEKLETVIDLGNIYPSNFVQKDEETIKVPLTLVKCTSCSLVQLRDTVDLDAMYRNYWYRSGLNNSMVKSLQDVATYAERFLKDGDVIVDIGCNDCTMLDMFNNRIFTVGFDPAKNLHSPARERCGLFFNGYFNAESYLNTGLSKAKVVTAIAMFYDLQDIATFVSDVDKILADDGVFIVQFTDLVSMLKINAVDNLCHEHLEYYSLEVMETIMWEVAKLVPIQVSHNKVNGGSIRVTFAKPDQYSVDTTVETAELEEADYLERYTLEAFSETAERIKKSFVNFISTSVRAGDTIAVMGASTKGNTLLQYYGLDSSLIDHAAEINPEKFGRYTIGTGIPIISERESLQMFPSAYVILPWHFIDNFIEKNLDYLNRGGILIVPLPEPRVYYLEDGEVKYYDIRY